MKARLLKIWEWLKANVFTKDMIGPFILAELIFWSPCIVTAVLALTISNWYWTAFTAVVAFWAGPFTPAVPLQLALALGIKKIRDKIRRKNKNDRSD